MKLHGKHVWKRLTALSKQAPGVVAVAYLGQGGAKQLPLRRGSVLVVNLSKQTVKAGITDPREILKLLRKGVRVHTVENLHAKVYVFGKTALIGSPNVSRFSANRLIEAALEVTRPGVVAACRAFVMSLVGDEVTKEGATAWVPHWSPPKHPAAVGPKEGGIVQPHHGRTWVAHVFDDAYDTEDETSAKRGRPIARERKRHHETLHEFVFCGGRFAREVQRHDVVVEVDRQGRDGTVQPAARVLHVERYWVRRERRVAVFLAVPKAQGPVPLQLVRTRLGPLASAMSDRRGYSGLLAKARTAHAVMNAIARGPGADD